MSIDAAELQTLLNREHKPLLINLRTPAEFESVHIPDSYNVPLPMFAEHREELAHRFQDGLVFSWWFRDPGHRGLPAPQGGGCRDRKRA